MKKQYICHGIIGCDPKDFNKNEDYLIIGCKWGDCKKFYDYSKKFAELEPEFVKEYLDYWNSTNIYAGAAICAWKTNIKAKIKILKRIIEIKEKYKDKVILVLDMYDLEVDVENLKKWFRNNNDLTDEEFNELYYKN